MIWTTVKPAAAIPNGLYGLVIFFTKYWHQVSLTDGWKLHSLLDH
jgi:hypothetical protein